MMLRKTLLASAVMLSLAACTSVDTNTVTDTAQVAQLADSNPLKNESTLPSELYDVKYSENATEVILMGEVTELERMPRDNLDNLEPLEGAYNRSFISSLDV